MTGLGRGRSVEKREAQLHDRRDPRRPYRGSFGNSAASGCPLTAALSSQGATWPGRLSDEANAARVRLARSQTSGAHCRLSAAVAPARPQSIALVPLRGQLAENLAALQRR